MKTKITLKRTLIAGVIFLLATGCFVGAGAAGPSPELGIELEYGDYDNGNYTAYVVLNGITDDSVFKSLHLNLTSTGVKILSVEKSDDLKITPNIGNNNDHMYQFNLYSSGKNVSKGVKLVKFTVNVSECTADPAYLNLSNFVGGDASSDMILQIGGTKYSLDGLTITNRTLSSANPHSFADSTAITKNIKVEDYLVRSDLSGDIGTIYSELGTEMTLADLNLSVAVTNPTASIYINTSSGNFTSVTGLNVSTDAAVGTVGLWNDYAGKFVDSRDLTFNVAQKTDLQNRDVDEVFNYTNTSYVRGSDINASILAQLTIVNHNIGNGTEEGFAREISKNDLTFAFEQGGVSVSEINETSKSGRYNFTINVPTLNNYAAVTITNNSYYFFELTGDQAPKYANVSAVDKGLLKVGEKANMSMTYTIDDFKNVKLANVSAVPKYYINTSYLAGQPEHAASLILPYCKAADSSFDGKYTYTNTTGEFKFKDEASQKVTGNCDYVFYLYSDRKLGDVDDDGYVNAADASFICNKLVQDQPDWKADEIFYGKTTGGFYNPTVLDALNIAMFDLGKLYS